MKVSLKEYNTMVMRFKEMFPYVDVAALDDVLKTGGYDNENQQRLQAKYVAVSDTRKMKETGKSRYELYYKDRYTRLAEESGMTIGDITKRGGVQKAMDIIETRKISII